MKICYILSTSEISGGANKSFLDLMKHIDRKKIEPVVLIRRQGEIVTALDSLKIDYYTIPYINSVTSGNKIKDFFKIIWGVLTDIWVQKCLSHKKIDIVHNNSLPALAGMNAAKNLNIPYICHIRENVKEGLGVEFLRPQKHYSVMGGAARNVVISNFIYGAYKDYLNPETCLTLMDGLEVETYLDPQKRIFQNDKITIAIYGNLDPQKGQLEAIKAVEQLSLLGFTHVSLKIAGNQSTKYGKICRKYVEERNIKNIVFRDAIKSSSELKKSREEDDINLICSSAEGLGRVTIESMLSGSLTIAANAGATPEIIEDGYTGILYQSNSEKDLAEKIAYAITHTQDSQEIAVSGRNYAQTTFAIEKYAKKITNIYYKILEESSE